MKNQTCVLCGLPLSDGKTNREHFIPATVIRSFDKLGIPAEWTHALRVNRYGAFSVGQVLPIASHREWATVEVHERCNLDASPMCQDLKRLIDGEQVDTSRIKQYYAHLWRYHDWTDISVSLGSGSPTGYESTLESLRPERPNYQPGLLSLGRLGIWAHHNRDLVENGVDGHHHSIYLGTKEELERWAR